MQFIFIPTSPSACTSPIEEECHHNLKTFNEGIYTGQYHIATVVDEYYTTSSDQC